LLIIPIRSPPQVEAIKERLLAANDATRWVPAYVSERRFRNWLEGAHDWAVSRNRFWGTPLPIWRSADGAEERVIGSVEELYEASGVRVTDLHRHFVDDITIPSSRGAGFPPLRRVEDVFDCWFESGSMPYAHIHYPFENKEFFEGNFPADFVAEGLDQTRGWFYTLMVLSTALFDKPAFKNLVCNGLVLAADGKKMSKSLKNYPAPDGIINEFGADALRLYLVNSPVVRAEPLRFQREGVFGVVKDVFLKWYNAYRFLVQNGRRAAAEPGGWDPYAVDLSMATNVLDRWIRAASHALVVFVREEMAAYRLYTVAPRLVRFIEALCNTYVRLNRGRLKGRGGREDAAMALATLYDVLKTLCVVMAPFTPFFTESMWRNLRRAAPAAGAGALPESVHFAAFPEAPPAGAAEERIQRSVARMSQVIELARTIRERHTRSVKTPLRYVQQCNALLHTPTTALTPHHSRPGGSSWCTPMRSSSGTSQASWRATSRKR
jgi:isoleucyl-tRNA synthetase